MQIVTEGNDLEGIEPSKSFRNAEDSVPYGAPKESDKLKFIWKMNAGRVAKCAR